MIAVITLLVLLSTNAALAGQLVYGLRLEGTIEPGLAAFVNRGMTEARQNQAAAILIELNTFGGRVDAATEIRDLIMASPVPVIAYVTERAWSAGALIATASHHLYMAPGSSIGAAEPRPAEEKTVAALRSEFVATAQGRDRDPQMAAAMVDKDVVIPGVVEAGKILSLPAKDAVEFGYADGLATSRREVLAAVDLAETDITWVELTWAERLARFVTEPTVSSLLLTIGFLGILLELFTAGFGLTGIIGLISLGLFFGGRIIAGLAGAAVIVLFVSGLVLLAIELGVPGGVFGVAGILAIITSIILSYSSARAAAYSLTVAVVLTIILFWWLSRYFKKSNTWGKLILKAEQTKTQGYVGTKANPDLVGKQGITLTACRPGGTVLIDDVRYDAITQGEYLGADVPVEVIGRSGAQVVIRQIHQPTDEGKGV